MDLNLFQGLGSFFVEVKILVTGFDIAAQIGRLFAILILSHTQFFGSLLYPFVFFLCSDQSVRPVLLYGPPFRIQVLVDKVLLCILQFCFPKVNTVVL